MRHLKTLALFGLIGLILSLGWLQLGDTPLTAHAAGDPRPLMPSIVPSVTLNVPASAFIGEDVNFTVTFDNPTSEEGYGPIIDLIIPTNGADGEQNTGSLPDTDPGYPDDQLDGLTFINATYLGVQVERTVLTFPGEGEVTCIDHPYFVDATNTPIEVCGDAGDTFVSLRLPFGSFTPDQPPAEIQVSTSMSSYADLGFPLTIQARGGYQFGKDPLNNPATDNPVETISPWISRSVEPTLITLSKSYSGPEDETATGPNYPRSYTVTARIAPGQTLTNFFLEDVLPDNMQFIDLTSTSPSAVGCNHNQDWTSTPGGTLRCDFGTVSGTVSMTFEFFIPLLDAGGDFVIDPETGAFVTSCNQALGGGDWVPLDPRDFDDSGTFILDPPGCEHTLSDQSIAIQKSVAVAGGGDAMAGKSLIYTLNIQVSDFFVFDDVVVTDTISDGQLFDHSFPPTLQVNGNTYTLSADDFGTVNFDVTCNYTGMDLLNECTVLNTDDPNDGTTTLTFRVSEEINDRGEDGRLVGGCVPLNGVGAGNDPDCAEYNNGATTAQIVYRTVIQREFNDLDPGSPGVVQGDQLDNTARVQGAVLSTDDASTATTFSPWDGTSAGVSIGRGDVRKTFYAINGDISIPDPVEIRPGDEITYRVRYNMPVGDVKELTFIDFFPLPVLRVNDPNADGSPGPAWIFETGAGIPDPGVVRFGPDDTFYAYTGIIPTLSTDVPNNSLEILYGDFFGVDEGPYVIDLLFTITVTDDPFADRLQLTNQIRIEEGSTAWGSFIDDGLIQFILTQPVVNIQKGVVWTENDAGVFNPLPPGPVDFLEPSESPRWNGTINSSSLEATPINSNLSGVDAGDTVTFAIVLENTGSSGNGAFDVIVKDTLPVGFIEPAGGINLQVFNGEGSQIIYSALSGGFFGDGIQLNNNNGSGSLGNFDPNSGENLAIITYDLVLANDVSPGQVITNTASLVRYAGAEGADNHLDTPRVDDAEVTIAEPVVKKELIATSQDHTTGTNVAIGEILTYEVIVTIPEGVSPNVTLTDTLDAGLAFVGCLEIDADADLSTSLDGGFNAACPSPAQDPALNPAVTLNGREISWNLGTITNANRNNEIAETLTITYDVIVINSDNNVRGGQRNNEAVWTWETGTAQDSAEDVIIVEPTLQVVKTATPNTGDAADTIGFSLVISHSAQSNSDAFEVSIFDDLSSLPYESVSVIDWEYDEKDCGTLVITYTSSGAEIDFHINVIPLDCAVTINFSAVLDITVSPDQVITNTAEITWQSLADGEIDNPSPYTGLDCERSGDTEACGGSANTYSAAGSDSVTIRSAQFTKELLTTELVNENNAVDEAVIGETIDYRVVLTLPEGTTPDLIIEDILDDGLAFVKCISVERSTDDLSTTFGDGDFSDMCVDGTEDSDNPTVTNDGRTITWTLGTVTNSSTDNSFTETIVIEYRAVVLNVAANQHGETRSNSARPFSDTSALTGPASAADVTIIEPVLNVTKAATIGGGSIGVPGDPVVYTITITNPDPGSPTDAYDIVVMDPLPQVDPPNDNRSLITGADIESVSAPPGISASNFDLSGNPAGGYVLETVKEFDLLVGETVTIVIEGTLLEVDPPAVSADQLIRNIVYMTWTSLPDVPGQISIYSADSTERDGSEPDGVNNYTTLDEADIRIQNIDLDKDLIDPSTGEVFLLGQAVRIGETIRYRVRFTIPNDVFLENLTFSDTLDPGLAYVDCVSISAHDDLNSDQLNAFSCDNPTIDVTNSGGKLDISFGVVENTNLIEARVIELQYTAVVLNTMANERDEELGNAVSASFFVNDDTTTLTDSAPDVTINEPSLSVVKTANPTEADAGDTITFTITVTSEDGANFSNAYDLVLEDQIPDGLIYVDGSFTFDDQNGGIAPTSPPAYDEDTNTLSAGWAVFPPGATSEFTFEAVIGQGVAPNQVIVNQAEIRYTSMPGDVSDVSDFNDLSCERTGDPSDCGGAANVYADDNDATVTIGDIEFSKALTATSADHTTGNDLTIGEVASFALTLTLPEGTIPALTVTDLIPTGMAYVANSFSIDESNFEGSYSFSVSPDQDQNGGDGENLVVAFSDVVVDAGIGTEDNVLIINSDAVVLNVIGNQAGGSLVNRAEYQIGDDDPVPSNDVTMPIVEPELSINKSFYNTTPPFEAGDTVSYQIIVTNTSGLTAFDVVISDTAYADVEIVNYTDEQDPAIPLIGLENNTSGNEILFNIADFPPGAILTIDYDVLLPNTLQVGETVANEAMVTWTSLPGEEPHERTGIPDDTLNDYVDEDDVRFTTELPDISKSVDKPNARIGETVRFTLTINSPLGTIRDWRIIDTLPAGLIYTGNVDTSGFAFPAPVVSSPNDGSVPVDVTWDMGESSVITSDPMTISFDAVVADVPANQVGVSLINAVNMPFVDGDENSRNPGDSADFEIIEPLLSVSKTAAPTTPALGGTVAYTLVISHDTASSVTAYDVLLSDVLPSELSLVAASVVSEDDPLGCAIGVSLPTPPANTLVAAIDVLPLNCVVTVEYSAQVISGSSGSTIPNAVNMIWTSMPGDEAVQQRDYSDSTSADITLTNPDLSVTKTSAGDSYVPGGDVIYTIVVSNIGNADVVNATLFDEKLDLVVRWSWDCEHAGGASGCTPTIGAVDTDFSDSFNLPVGASITYTVTAEIASWATDELVNTVVVSLPEGLIDPTPENNFDTDRIDQATPVADLVVTKDVDSGLISPGVEIIYTIIVSNQGPSDANGALVTDPIPGQIEYWTWECTAATGGASGCEGVIDSDQDFSDTVNLPAGASLTYRVTARVASGASGILVNTVRVDPPDGVEDPNMDNNEDSVENPILSDSGKRILETNQPASSGQNVLIGEIVTYEISMKIPANSTLQNLGAVDQLDDGLAFLACLDVYVSDPNAVTTDLVGGFENACPADSGDPRITGEGRRIALSFGNVSNQSDDDQWLYVRYDVVVLNIDSNTSGVQLDNRVLWSWTGGELENSAVPVNVIEPLIQIEKSVNRPVAPLNTTLTFTLKVSHLPESTAPGFELVLEDQLPFGLNYAGNVTVMGTPYDDFEYDEITATLRFYWDVFSLTDYSEITFDAVFVGPGPIENVASLEWKSLPDDLGQQSDYNIDSTRRAYDPASLIEITQPVVETVIDTPILPDTGFTPGVVTRIPPQQGAPYRSLPGIWLEIPDLNLRRPILSIPLTDQGWALSWLGANVGHLEGSTILTDVGNSVLTAHAVLPNGLDGPFSDLSSLRWGQQVILHAHGVQYIYEVRLNYIVRPDNHFIFSEDGYAWLTLLTCRDYDPLTDSFLFRDVVRAVLIEVIP